MPLIARAAAFAREGIATGASARNWAGYGEAIDWPASAADWQRTLMADPQTSGGLLATCAPEAAEDVLRVFREYGFADAAGIGQLQASTGTGPLLKFVA